MTSPLFSLPERCSVMNGSVGRTAAAEVVIVDTVYLRIAEAVSWPFFIPSALDTYMSFGTVGTLVQLNATDTY